MKHTGSMEAEGQLEEGEWCGCPMQQSPRGGKMGILSEKNLIFCTQKIFNYQSK
jgi:hypothetical protein